MLPVKPALLAASSKKLQDNTDTKISKDTIKYFFFIIFPLIDLYRRKAGSDSNTFILS